MKTTEKNAIKRVYLCPEIEIINLDNEISLILVSNPPFGPGESEVLLLKPEYMKIDPYNNVG